MNKLRYYLSKPIGKTVAITIISILAIIIYVIFSGIKSIVSYCDAFFVCGAILICLGMLSLVTYYGVFDIFGYSTSYVYNGMKKGSVQRYKDFHDYIQQKTEKRKKKKYNFLPYLAIGIVYIIVAAILLAFIR